jgi:hypothetical protein
MGRSRRLRNTLSIVGLATLFGSLLVGAPPVASAQDAPQFSISTTSGPIGTVVQMSGNVGTGCGGAASVEVQFSIVSNSVSSNVQIQPPVGAGGSWTASFEIPQFLDGGATFTTQPVNPGPYEFKVLSCSTLTAPFTVTGTLAAQPATRFVGMARTPDGGGYWLAQTGGGVYAFGDAAFYGSLQSIGVVPCQPITGIAATPDGHGYWLVAADGGVYAFGDAHFYGSLPGDGVVPFGRILGIVPSPDGGGYWLVGADGGVFTFGDAHFYGSVSDGIFSDSAMAAAPSGAGYWLFDLAGLAMNFGDAALIMPNPSTPFDAWFSSFAPDATGKGIWAAGTDGGVFAFGDAPFYGSLPSIGVAPTGPVVGIVSTPSGAGYWLVSADGGVFAFGDAGFYGSAASSGLPW